MMDLVTKREIKEGSIVLHAYLRGQQALNVRWVLELRRHFTLQHSSRIQTLISFKALC